MSQYMHCACRDCFEIVIASNDPDEPPTLCDACEEAGCEANNGECQAHDAYGGEG
jgi:hypothetical protein